MRYPVAIEPGGENRAYGVVVPDLPGCFSGGDTLDEALSAAEEAILVWIDATLDAGEAIPAPSTIEDIGLIPDYAGWKFAMVDFRPA